MSLSTRARTLLLDYNNASQSERNCVDDAVAEVIRTFELHGFLAATDDRLAEVEAVIFNYLRES